MEISDGMDIASYAMMNSQLQISQGVSTAGVEKDDGSTGSTGHSARADDGTVGKSGTWTEYRHPHISERKQKGIKIRDVAFHDGIPFFYFVIPDAVQSLQEARLWTSLRPLSSPLLLL